jgi:hypothetical protein
MRLISTAEKALRPGLPDSPGRSIGQLYASLPRLPAELRRSTKSGSMPAQTAVKIRMFAVQTVAGTILSLNCFQLVLGRLLTAMAL